MCVGRTPDEALDIVLDALPTALECDFVYLSIPGSPSKERAALDGAPMAAPQIEEVRAVTASDADGGYAEMFLSNGKLWCIEAEITAGTEHGRLLAGRRRPLHPETDRVLIRTAANIVGTIFQTANVLEAARRKDDFLAILGHELRNPLAPIMTAVELLARNSSAARERNIIDRHLRHLARLVDDLLDISRATHGHVELRREYVSLNSIFERAVEIAAPLVNRHRHAVTVAGGHEITLLGDPVRLAQIFGNLLTNAAKFTPPEGHIDVFVGTTPGRVQVSVRDDGRGIARGELDRIFEPFVQAGRERNELQGGLGLGLAIVKTLVQRHGGSISVQSEGPGRGATFTVDLPTVVHTERPKGESAAQPSEARAGVRVLVVDDEVDIAELLSEALQDEGFQTEIAHDADGALARWRSFSPHAGILDIGLPDRDGYELAKTLRAEHGRAATLIAATGYGQPTDRLRATDAGFDCHLVKPVSVHDLVLVLDEHVVSTKPSSRS
jgi:signal transduction histidine kinase/CheY-like chemotaxis protein